MAEEGKTDLRRSLMLNGRSSGVHPPRGQLVEVGEDKPGLPFDLEYACNEARPTPLSWARTPQSHRSWMFVRSMSMMMTTGGLQEDEPAAPHFSHA
eukprot:scaffold39224_cov31-Tisochrysis_lutea.AAC.3